MTPPDTLTDTLPELTRWRHDLHRHPELAFREHRTADFIAGKLREFGLDPITGIAETGVVAVVDSGQPGLCVALRADMDALPLDDQGGKPYASTIAGQAHACGHDGHSVALLGAARQLAARPPQSGRVVLIFQPAEESVAGAAAMIEAGIVERFGIDEIYAFHNMPALDSGTAAVIAGTTLNGACLWEIDIEGVGGHGAAFYDAVDPLQAMARLATEISSIVGRYLKPSEAGLITIGKMAGGSAANVIPATAQLAGTLRGSTAETMEVLRSHLARACDGIAALTGCTVTLRILIDVPPCINAPLQSEVAARACGKLVGEDRILRQMPPLPFTDDFAHFLAKIPGAYFFLGQDGVMCHHPAYDFDDRLLGVAAGVFLAIIADRLGPA
ncbi:MAG: amidohydrolase [Proteobacteria bacterium ST_bin13]|jgi:hippurate hydrolase|nr:MAG: amidohydrolase [Proteobacteria bacterium ST_bin13]